MNEPRWLEHEERRLLAILSGDVAAYSRLMAEDERATVELLSAARDVVARAALSRHGRVVDFVGDNFLAEFPSALHAVDAAIAIQREIAALSGEGNAAGRFAFRIGGHVGDVRIVGDRLYGSGVNIAARLEALAPIGGLCLSQQLYEQVAGHLALAVTDIGPQALKHIVHSVRAYTVAFDALPATACDVRAAAAAGSPLTHALPVIAVLPFASLSRDPEDAYLADGLTADVTNGLGCDPRLGVIAHGAMATFRGASADITQVGRAVGASHVVTGSVRRLGGTLRIVAELVEVASRRELWSGRIDGETSALFAALDDLVEAIVTALSSHLKLAEAARFRRRRPEQMDAWGLLARASLAYFSFPTTSLAEPLALAERATVCDPGYAYAWAVLGFLRALKFALGLSTDHETDIEDSLAATGRALALDPRDPWVLTAHAAAVQYSGRPAASLAFLERSLRANPSEVFTHCYYGRGLMFSGQPERAIAHFERFERLNPNDPCAHQAAMYHAIANVFAQRWPDAEKVAEGAVARAGGRNPWSWVMLAIAQAAQGRPAEARASLDEMRVVTPHWSYAFVETFLVECQADRSLVEPLLVILREVWPS